VESGLSEASIIMGQVSMTTKPLISPEVRPRAGGANAALASEHKHAPAGSSVLVTEVMNYTDERKSGVFTLEGKE
jgi:hypothetical protein